MTAPLYIALIHYPVLNKNGDIVTTSLTNFDLHDLGRTSKTYGVKSCFIVTPNSSQQEMGRYIMNYWQEGIGSQYNPDRRDAFGHIEITADLEQTRLTIEKNHDTSPHLIATSARESKKPISFSKLRKGIESSTEPFLLLFGTGWGLAPPILDETEAVLEPILGPTEYNHLPVRAAVAIVLDRLLG